MDKSLREIFENHSGRLIHKLDHYIEVYETFFEKYRNIHLFRHTQKSKIFNYFTLKLYYYYSYFKIIHMIKRKEKINLVNFIYIMFYNDELIIMVYNDQWMKKLRFLYFAMLIIHDLSGLNIKKGVSLQCL